MAEHDPWRRWFEGVWAYREETLYRRWFGDTGPGVYVLKPQLFAGLGVKDPDPRWLHHGVFECPPANGREHWAYITTGLSNPWGQDPTTIDSTAFSGLGVEFLMYAPAKAPWALGVLSWLSAVTLLVAAGRLHGDLPEIHDRIPLGISLNAESASPLTHLVLSEPPDVPKRFQLESGVADLMLCVGITDKERDFAREHGSGALGEKLRGGGGFPVTDPGRRGTV